VTSQPAVRLDPRDPLVLSLRELGRRPGSMRRLSRTAPCPTGLRVGTVGVPEAAELALDVRLESVVEGVLVSGAVRAPVTGECARCLEPVESSLTAELLELFAYDPADDPEDETPLVEGELIDLEPVLRDAVVLALPLQPVCRADCPGLCPECGERLADTPGHTHETVDPRWAALTDLRQLVSPAPDTGDHSEQHTNSTPNSTPNRKRASRGRTQAEDLAQQHAQPPCTVEGLGADPRPLRPLPGAEAAAHRVPDVRHLQPPPDPRGLTAAGRVPVPASGLTGAAALLEQRLGVTVQAELFERALTHRSYAYEHGGLPTNERLEFLGDAVLGLVVTDALYRTHPDLPEGQLAKLRAAVVNMRALADVGRQLDLGSFVRLGRGEEVTGGRDKSSILADTLEALLGAVYLDRGLVQAGALVHRLFDELIASAAGLGAGLDWKTSLQELTAEAGMGVPEYVVAESGPDHQKSFTATVVVGGADCGSGLGRSKKEAEQRAAEVSWTRLRRLQAEPHAAALPGGNLAAVRPS